MSGPNGNQPRSILDVSAESWRSHMKAYRRAGFTDKQAFQLTLAAFKTTHLLGEINRILGRSLNIDPARAMEALRRLLDEGPES